MILAVAAIALVACSKTFNTANNEGTAIGFGTWTETMTKNITDPRTAGSGTFGVGDSFAVYGYKETTSPAAKVTVFDDVAVEMTATGVPGTWTYSPIRFWDKNYDQYTFFAISPSSVGTQADGENDSSVNVNPQDGSFTTRTITFDGNNSDILVADKKTVAKANYSSSAVQMDFNHVASWVDFKVNKAPNLTNATVTVSAFALSNIQTAGRLSVSNAYNVTTFAGDGTTGPAVSWSSTATGGYNTGNGVTPVSLTSPIEISEDTAFNPASPTTPAAATFLINTLIVKPQSFTAPTTRATPADASNDGAQRITITYQIAVANGGTNEYTATLWLSDFDTVNDDSAVPNEQAKVGSWDPGKHYTFYITLDATPIAFGASIHDWNTGNGYHYLVK